MLAIWAELLRHPTLLWFKGHCNWAQFGLWAFFPSFRQIYWRQFENKFRPSPEFVHIKLSPVETDPIDVLLGLPRGKPRNPVNRKQATRRPNGLVVHRSTSPENLVVIRRRTRLHVPPGFPASPSRAGGLSTRRNTVADVT